MAVAAQPTELSAEVQTVTFYNEGTNYCIAKVRSKDEPGPFSIVGHLGKLTPGEMLRVTAPGGQYDLNEHVVSHADEWREFGVFPPAIDPPEGADDETRLLCAVGFWQP